MYEKPNKLRASLLGGLVIGVVSGIPGLSLINCCCCAGIICGGALSVYLYKQEFTSDMASFETADALTLGVFSGIVGALITTFLSTILFYAFGPVQAELLRSFVEKTGRNLLDSGSLPQESYDQLHEQMERAVNEKMTVSALLQSLIVGLIAYPLFSMLGSLIGYGLFRPKKSSVPSVPPEQP